MTETNWRQNCLTAGPHDGRPESIWNLPLVQAQYMFTPMQLQQLVIDRIYNDAMQMVEHGENPKLTKEWAEKTKEMSAPLVNQLFLKKVAEIMTYYTSVGFKSDLDGAIGFNRDNKLNPRYEPLHPHDTINLLCRMVGQPCAAEAL